MTTVTAFEAQTVGAWMIVGLLTSGERIIIEELATEAAAQARAETLGPQLEDYTALYLERYGKDGRCQVWPPVPAQATPPIAATPPAEQPMGGGMDKIDRIKPIKERPQTMQATHEQHHANGNGQAATMPPAGNRFDRAKAAREKLKQLGQDATRRELGDAVGFEVSESAFARYRDDVGFRPRRPGVRSAPSPVKEHAKPEAQAPAPVATQPAAAQAAPTAPTTDGALSRALEGMALLAQAADRLGGIAGARRALETLELLQGGCS